VKTIAEFASGSVAFEYKVPPRQVISTNPSKRDKEEMYGRGYKGYTIFPSTFCRYGGQKHTVFSNLQEA
jgi:hypothetical protein